MVGCSCVAHFAICGIRSSCSRTSLSPTDSACPSESKPYTVLFTRAPNPKNCYLELERLFEREAPDFFVHFANSCHLILISQLSAPGGSSQGLLVCTMVGLGTIRCTNSLLGDY